jgi:thiosulfate reductase cytochrome b subunit
MKTLSSPRFLAIYSGVLTLVFAVTVLCGFAMLRNPQFGIVTARRINCGARWHGAAHYLQSR